MRNQNSVAMVRYQTGGFGMGVEWLYGRSTWNTASAVSNPMVTTAASEGLRTNNVLEGNQISASFNYYF
jgi:hypothetical protein